MSITLGSDLGTRLPVCLSAQDRGLGTYVIGLTGTGKSTLLLNMMVQDVEAGHGLTLLDPHGDLAPDLLKRIPQQRRSDVVYLDFGDKAYPPGFDIFASSKSDDVGVQAQEVAAVIDAFRKLLGKESWGPRLENVLRMTALAFRDNPGCTMTEIATMLTHDAFRQYCMEHITNPDVLAYWRDYDAKKSKESFIESTMTKVYPFITNPLLKQIVGQPGKVIDFAAVLAKQRIVIVRIPIGILKEQATSFLAYLVVDRLLTAAFARAELPASQRPFHAIYCDEFQMYATPDFEEFIAGGRKYGVGLLIAHQWQEQLDEATRAAGRAGRNTIVFQVSDSNAPSFARGFKEMAIPRPPRERPVPMDPWKLLESKGHPDPEITERTRAIKSWLIQLTNSLQREWGANSYTPALMRTAVLDPIDHALNEYLYGALAGTLREKEFVELGRYGGWTGDVGSKENREDRETLLVFISCDLFEIGRRLRILGMPGAEDERPAQAEIARDLSSLPSYHAKCKLMHDGHVSECTLKTFAPWDPQPDYIAKEIIRRSRDRYCTKATEVDQALAAFQRELEEVEAEEQAPTAEQVLYDSPPKRF